MRSSLTSLAAALLIPLALSTSLHVLSLWPLLLCWLVAVNLTLAGLMWKDKRAARKPRGMAPRTPELTLLALTFAGGTPAMLGCMYWLRHKTSKADFFYTLMGTIALQTGALVYFWPSLQSFW